MGRRSILGSSLVISAFTCLLFYAATNSFYVHLGPLPSSSGPKLGAALIADLIQPHFRTTQKLNDALNQAIEPLNPNSPVHSTTNRAANRAASLDAVKIYMYDLPRKFTYGVIERYLMARGALQIPVKNDSELRYPGNQHSAEWFLFSDLLKPSSDRTDSPVEKVTNPEEADLFYVPFFSSLSLVVNSVAQSGVGNEDIYSDEGMQEELVKWLERQVYWKRGQGRDHVIVCQDPNALYKVIDRFKNSVLLISDLGRLKADQASLVKDVILPYSHRINSYRGEIRVEQRELLLFFMGNRFRKEGGRVRDLLFQVLEDEEDIVIKHGTQSRESRRLATQGMHNSKFCLHPAGDTPSACRLFDAIVSLCVPVIVSDDIELPFEDVIDYTKIAIFVESSTAVQPGYLASMLRAIGTEKLLQYQREIKKVTKYFEFEEPDGTVNEIWRQVASKLPLIKRMINREKRFVKEVTAVDCSCLCSNHGNSSISGLP